MGICQDIATSVPEEREKHIGYKQRLVTLSKEMPVCNIYLEITDRIRIKVKGAESECESCSKTIKPIVDVNMKRVNELCRDIMEKFECKKVVMENHWFRAVYDIKAKRIRYEDKLSLLENTF